MSYAVLDDAELQRIVREKDDHNAFQEIYNRYWKLLLYKAYNIIQDKIVAQDLVQEVFISLWQRKGQVEIQHLGAYLGQAIRFQTLKYLRDQKASDQFYHQLADITAEIVYETPMLFKEQQALLQQTLDTLPEDCRKIFHLSREEQFTYKQIAELLQISEKTVEKKMSICLKHMRQYFRDNLEMAIIFFFFIESCRVPGDFWYL